MSYLSTLNYIKNRRENDINGIPTTFQSLKKILPAFDRNQQIILASNNGTGKTSFVWKYAVVDTINFLIKNSDKIDGHIYFVSLELTKDMVMIKLFQQLLYKKFNKTYPLDVFLSLTNNRLTDEELHFLEVERKKLLEFFDTKVTILDKNNTVKGLSKDLSALIIKSNTVHNEKFLNIIIVDTVNAIGLESGQTKTDAMKEWNQEYCLKLFRNELNCCIINIMQLDKQSQQKQFTVTGQKIEEKLIPTKDSIAGDKEASNSCSLMLALFNPTDFGLDSWNGYNVIKFEKGFRMLYVLKNNFGETNVCVPFFYHGVSNSWQEITESPEEFRKNPDLYKKYI